MAKVIVTNIEKEDLETDKLVYNLADPDNKIYIKNGIKIKKLSVEKLEIVKKVFEFKLDTYGESYYLSLLDEDDEKVNEAEKGKRINEKIARDKRRAFGLKIVSSLIISIVWGALTIYDLMGSGDDAVKKAWMNLLSRLCALVTSYLSGFSTSVVNTRDKARAIENKTDILKYFKKSYESKMFIPETYEQMIEREYQEQKEKENAYKKLFDTTTGNYNEEVQIAESINEQESVELNLQNE